MHSWPTFRVTGLALHLPELIETANDLSLKLDRSPEWIRVHTGVHERRISCDSMAVMGASAAAEALGDGPPPDLIINASLTPIQLIPDSSVFIQKELGLTGIPSFSIHATCLSFAIAFRQAVLLVDSGAYRRILIVSAEQGSVCRDFADAESAALIGDGAAAVVIEPAEGVCSRLVDFEMRTWPEGAGLAEIRGCGTRRHPNHQETENRDNLFQMNGREIYRQTIRRFSEVIGILFDRLGITPADIDLVVPHQPSGPALEILPRFGFAAERVVNLVGLYGNCIAASMPMALATAARDGRLRPGARVLMVGTSAGVSVAGMVVEW